MWGAFTEGLYYIKSNQKTEYYLCPSIGCYYGNNVDQPHLTTFKTEGDQYSIWKIVPTGETDTYYIIHYKTGRYLKSNENFTTVEKGATKNNRKAVHLEVKPETLTDDFKFLIKNSSSSYQIYPKVYWNTDVANMSFNPTNEHQDCYAPADGAVKDGGAKGMIGLYSKTDNFSKWQIPSVASAPCATPIIKYDGDNINISYPYSDETGITIYYTTDGSDPSTGTSNASTNFNISASGVIKVRAIATKTGFVNSDEAVLWGSARPFLIQSKECVDYYLVPAGDGTNVNTSSLPGTSMQWTLQNAGASTGGVQYYYVVNSNNKKINYNSSDNTLTLNEESANANKFCVVENGYGTGYFFLIPVSQTDRVLYKNNGNVDANNCKAELNKKWDTNLDQWKVIACNETADQKNLFSAAPFSVSNDDETHYYHIASVGQEGYYIVPPSDPDGFATTSNTDYNDTPWLFKVAASDNWLTYYYIINAASGKYMYFNPKNNQTADQENVISLKAISEKNAENEEKFQFIMVRSTTTGACYIVPKGYSYADASHKNFNTNKYFGLRANESGPLKSTWSRISTGKHVKWTFAEADITNLYLNPVFSQDESGNITIIHPTAACDIYYTIDGTDPSTSSAVYDNTNGLSSTEQQRIMAIAKLKTNSSIVSDVVTLLNNPDITVEEITYNGTAQEPGITKVSIGETGSETVAPSTAYSASSYGGDNINAGTDAATVTLSDADATDLWCIWNAATTFSIGKAPLTITPTADLSKVYGEDDPTLTYSSSIATTSGLYGTDAFDGALGREEGENVGNYAINQGTLKVIRESTDVSANYDITIADESFAITERAITISGITASEKTYDGNTTATLVYTDVTYGNIKDGDVLTVTATGSFDSKNAGTGKTVTISGLTLGGTDAANYTLPASGQQDEATADINPKPLTITNVDFTANSKTYDGTTAADFGSIDISHATIEGLIEGDDLTIVSATGTFDDKNVGTGKTVTITGFTFGGADAANYTYNGGDLTTTADITPAEVTVKADDKTKGYGDADPEFTAIVTGLQNGEDASVITFTTVSREPGENVGNYTITMTGNTSQGNYKVTEYTTGQLTITAKSLGDGTVPAPGITIDVSKAGETYSVTVKQNENTLVQGADKDYTWTGTGTDTYVVTVEGKGNYTGSAQAKFINLNFYGTNQGEGTSTEGQTETAAAYCAAEDLQATGGVKAYTVTAVDVENNIVYITEIKAGEVNYIPQDVPVLLLGDASTEGFTLKPYSGATVTIGEENLLKQSDGSIAVTTPDYYIFYEGAFVLSMWGEGKTMKNGKFYVHPTESSSSPAPAYAGLRLVRDGTTMVDAIVDNSDFSNQQHPEEWYTLDGQKLNKKPSRKGLYILNGQKVVIK